MPSPPEEISDTMVQVDTTQVSTLEMVSSAGSAVSDVAGFCARQPDVCRTASYVAGRLEAKAKYSVRLLYEWASDATSDPELPAGIQQADQLQTGSTLLALAEPQKAKGQSTLKIEDLIPEWRSPAPPKKKG
jgi:hypothetical protein